VIDIRNEDYSPSHIREHLRRWRELQAIAEGATGSLASTGGGHADRTEVADVIADLERAADGLPLDWRGTLEVFRLQERAREWGRRRLVLDDSIDLERAIEFMAHSLGWRGY
jgi:hypothetical protein